MTDDGLEHLAGLQNLEEWLGLTDTAVTDAGLRQLTNLVKLRQLNLRRTRVTETGVKEFNKVLPRTDISFGK